MTTDPTMSVLFDFLELMSTLVVFALGLGAAAILVMFVVDVTQSKHAIRRNFPVIGRFRYFFENLGEFFRQYFFAMDREELPFNRAQRSWVYRAAKNVDNTVAFGSTRDLRPVGTVLFVNCPFPTLGEDAVESEPLVIGPHCASPYLARSPFNISGMSYGAISRPAVLALSKGAALAGCWMNTGEGGISRWHLEGGDGGTGAAPMALIDDVGLALGESLPMVVDKLTEHGLRERVRVIASGKRVTASEVAWALCMGADFAVSARGFMFALGCIQALQCDRNTCPTGITTHDRRLQRGLVPADKALRVASYHRNLVREVGVIAHACGVPSPLRLRRHHARVVTHTGASVPLDRLHPVPAARTPATPPGTRVA